jgi:hypothetical protein
MLIFSAPQHEKSRTGFPMRLWFELWRRSLVAAGMNKWKIR